MKNLDKILASAAALFFASHADAKAQENTPSLPPGVGMERVSFDDPMRRLEEASRPFLTREYGPVSPIIPEFLPGSREDFDATMLRLRLPGVRNVELGLVERSTGSDIAGIRYSERN